MAPPNRSFSHRWAAYMNRINNSSNNNNYSYGSSNSPTPRSASTLWNSNLTSSDGIYPDASNIARREASVLSTGHSTSSTVPPLDDHSSRIVSNLHSNNNTTSGITLPPYGSSNSPAPRFASWNPDPKSSVGFYPDASNIAHREASSVLSTDHRIASNILKVADALASLSSNSSAPPFATTSWNSDLTSSVGFYPDASNIARRLASSGLSTDHSTSTAPPLDDQYNRRVSNLLLKMLDAQEASKSSSSYPVYPAHRKQ